MENRPSENGRGVIIHISAKESVDILPKKFNVRAKIHTYGGGAASMCPDGRIIFTDANTTGVFFLSESGEVEEIIPGSKGPETHYSDFSISAVQPDLILAVREVHQQHGEAIDSIVVINTNTKAISVVVQGADFYSHPKFSPDGKHISWTQWNHPDMPWTGSQVHVADWVNEEIINDTHIAGKSLQSAVCQPKWGPDGKLWFVDEPEGIWQFYRYDLTSKHTELVHIAGYENVEMGKAEWFLGK